MSSERCGSALSGTAIAAASRGFQWEEAVGPWKRRWAHGEGTPPVAPAGGGTALALNPLPMVPFLSCRCGEISSSGGDYLDVGIIRTVDDKPFSGSSKCIVGCVYRRCLAVEPWQALALLARPAVKTQSLVDGSSCKICGFDQWILWTSFNASIRRVTHMV